MKARCIQETDVNIRLFRGKKRLNIYVSALMPVVLIVKRYRYP